jgi:NhaP-type Na+/H+ or K+/H+ antiporter
MYENFAILGAFVYFYSLISGGLEKTPINGAVVFTLFGFICGPLGFDVLNMHITAEALRMLAELTLALVLFTDAAHANLGILKRSLKIPERLLFIGQPLIIVLGFGAGMLVFTDLSWLEVAILATMLAPTDAALGKAVVTNHSVPGKIREGLNMESGLNAGICVPVLFILLALVPGTAEGHSGFLAVKLVVKEIGIGLAVGMGLTYLAAKLIKIAAQRGWITETWRQLPVLVLALSCYAGAQLLGGSGFIACFSGGLVGGALARRHKTDYLLATEGTGDTMAVITWICFGAAVVGQSIGAFSGQVVLYSVLSLTVIRMLPVFLVMTGLKLRTGDKLFLGWFGPRGLASIVFAVIVLNKQLPHANTISMTVVCTIILSVLSHGLSANPLIAALFRSPKKTALPPAAEGNR